MEKVLCYGCLPIVFDKLLGTGGEHSSIVVVVTPLTAIMKDQVSGIVTIDDVCYLYLASSHTFQTASFTSRGLFAAYITGQSENEDMKRGVHKGVYRLVYFTPELLITSRRWRKVLSSDIYNARLKAFVIDEAHCVKKW